MNKRAACLLIGNREKREISGGSGRKKRHPINDNHTTLLPRMDMIACMFSLKPCIMYMNLFLFIIKNE
jgi:hypothetical protein